MRFWKRFWRDCRRAMGTHHYSKSAERLARLQAYRWSLQEEVVVISRIEPIDSKECLVVVRNAYDFLHKITVYSNYPMQEIHSYVRLQYHPEPNEATITFFGQNQYRSQPDAYLSLAP